MKTSQILVYAVGVVALVGLGLGIANMTQQRNLADLIIDTFIDPTEGQQSPASGGSGSGSTPTTRQPNGGGTLNSVPVLTQTEAASIVARDWSINMNPDEGHPPTVSINRTSDTAYGVTLIVPALDDSVASYRSFGMFSYVNGIWVLSRQDHAGFACWPGRGHQDYSNVPCF